MNNNNKYQTETKPIDMSIKYYHQSIDAQKESLNWEITNAITLKQRYKEKIRLHRNEQRKIQRLKLKYLSIESKP